MHFNLTNKKDISHFSYFIKLTIKSKKILNIRKINIIKFEMYLFFGIKNQMSFLLTSYFFNLSSDKKKECMTEN